MLPAVLLFMASHSPSTVAAPAVSATVMDKYRGSTTLRPFFLLPPIHAGQVGGKPGELRHGHRSSIRSCYVYFFCLWFAVVVFNRSRSPEKQTCHRSVYDRLHATGAEIERRKALRDEIPPRGCTFRPNVGLHNDERTRSTYRH